MVDTIEVRDEQFDAEEALEAAEAAQDEDGNVQGTAAQVGNTVVHGDGANDGDVFIVDTEQGVSSGLVPVSTVVERAEEAVKDFAEYLDKEVFTDGGYTYEDTFSGDTRVAEHSDGSGFVIPEDLERAIEDHNVGVRCIKDGWLCLEDKRDEEAGLDELFG